MEEKTPAADQPAYFEDLVLDREMEIGRHRVSKEEILRFAREWDPQPFHVDEAAAKAYGIRRSDGVVLPHLRAHGADLSQGRPHAQDGRDARDGRDAFSQSRAARR